MQKSQIKSQHFADTDVSGIYFAYPRRVAAKVAHIAIRKALVEISCRDGVEDPISWLLGRVNAFAKSQVGRERCYIPHCSTFMNQGRYDDDDREWSSWRKNGTVAPERKVAVSSAIQTEIDSIRATMAGGAWKRMDERSKGVYEDRLKELGG